MQVQGTLTSPPDPTQPTRWKSGNPPPLSNMLKWLLLCIHLILLIWSKSLQISLCFTVFYLPSHLGFYKKNFAIPKAQALGGTTRSRLFLPSGCAHVLDFLCFKGRSSQSKLKIFVDSNSNSYPHFGSGFQKEVFSIMGQQCVRQDPTNRTEHVPPSTKRDGSTNS